MRDVDVICEEKGVMLMNFCQGFTNTIIAVFCCTKDKIMGVNAFSMRCGYKNTKSKEPTANLTSSGIDLRGKQLHHDQKSWYKTSTRRATATEHVVINLSTTYPQYK